MGDRIRGESPTTKNLRDNQRNRRNQQTHFGDENDNPTIVNDQRTSATSGHESRNNPSTLKTILPGVSIYAADEFSTQAVCNRPSPKQLHPSNLICESNSVYQTTDKRRAWIKTPALVLSYPSGGRFQPSVQRHRLTSYIVRLLSSTTTTWPRDPTRYSQVHSTGSQKKT